MKLPMDKTKIAKMDMEAFRQVKELEADRDKWKDLAKSLIQVAPITNPVTLDHVKKVEEELDYWKDIAIGLADSGFCEFCESRAAVHLQYCPDEDGWHRAYDKLPEEFK
jgi:hypothetical protein